MDLIINIHNYISDYIRLLAIKIFQRGNGMHATSCACLVQCVSLSVNKTQ